MVELRLPQMHLKSVCLCELWQEGEAYEKTAQWAAPRPFLFCLVQPSLQPSLQSYPLILLITHSCFLDRTARRSVD